MYKSIIFDLGGVMVDFDPKAYLVDRLCNAAIEEQVYDLTFGSEEWQQLDAGLVSRFNGNSSMLKKAKAAGFSPRGRAAAADDEQELTTRQILERKFAELED